MIKIISTYPQNNKREFLHKNPLFIIVCLFIFFITDLFILEDSFFATDLHIYSKYYYNNFDSYLYLKDKTEDIFFSNKIYQQVDDLKNKYWFFNRQSFLIEHANKNFLIDSKEYLNIELIRLTDQRDYILQFKHHFARRNYKIDTLLDDFIVNPVLFYIGGLSMKYLFYITETKTELHPFNIIFVYAQMAASYTVLVINFLSTTEMVDIFISTEYLKEINEYTNLDLKYKNIEDKLDITELEIRKVISDLLLTDSLTVE